MEVLPTATPNIARGEVLLTIAGSQYPVRFSLRVLHAYTQATGHSLADIGKDMGKDLLGTIAQLLTQAVRAYVPVADMPSDFTLGDGLDLMEVLSPKESDEIADAIWAAIQIDTNPLLAALIAKAPKLSVPATNGDSTSTSPSAN